MEPTPELLSYVREQLAAGFTRPVLEQTLQSAGWQQPMIDAAFAQLVAEEKGMQPEPVVPVSPDPVASTQPLAQEAISQPEQQSQPSSYDQVFAAASEPLSQPASPESQNDIVEPMVMDASDLNTTPDTGAAYQIHNPQQPTATEPAMPSYEQATMPQASVGQQPMEALPVDSFTSAAQQPLAGSLPDTHVTDMIQKKPSVAFVILEAFAIFLMLVIIGALVYLIVRSAQGHEALAFNAPQWLGNIGDALRGLFGG